MTDDEKEDLLVELCARILATHVREDLGGIFVLKHKKRRQMYPNTADFCFSFMKVRF